MLFSHGNLKRLFLDYKRFTLWFSSSAVVCLCLRKSKLLEIYARLQISSWLSIHDLIPTKQARMLLCYFLAVKIYCVRHLSYSDVAAFAYHCSSPVVCRAKAVQLGKITKFLKNFQEAAKSMLLTIKCNNWACCLLSFIYEWFSSFLF